MWSVTYLSSSLSALEFLLLLTLKRSKAFSNQGFLKKRFNNISLIYDRLLQLSTSCQQLTDLASVNTTWWGPVDSARDVHRLPS